MQTTGQTCSPSRRASLHAPCPNTGWHMLTNLSLQQPSHDLSWELINSLLICLASQGKRKKLKKSKKSNDSRTSILLPTAARNL